MAVSCRRGAMTSSTRCSARGRRAAVPDADRAAPLPRRGPAPARRRRAWERAVRAAAVGDARADVRLRPRAGHRPHRRHDRDVRAGRRPAAAPEPLLPLPRDRQRHRPLGRAGGRDGRVHRRARRAAPARPAPRSGHRAPRSRDRHRRRRGGGRNAPTASGSRRATCSPTSPRRCSRRSSASRRPTPAARRAPS